MKFQTKIKLIKKIDKVKLKIRDALHKKPFYKYLYKHILDEFKYNNKSCIRYYMDTNTLRDESFKSEIQLYHKVYRVTYNEYYLEGNFMYTKDYIDNKLSGKYPDLQFIYGEDECGLYFEIGYSEGY